MDDVAKALAISTTGVRDEWAAYDLQTADGVKIEVKSSAYLQSWAQSRESTIVFSIRKARAWDPNSNQLASVATREGDVYVFALLAHRDKATLDPLDTDQCEFYVVPTSVLNERLRSQDSITLDSLKTLNAGPVPYHGLQDAVASWR